MWKTHIIAHGLPLGSCSSGSPSRRHSAPTQERPSLLPHQFHSRRLPPRSIQVLDKASIKALTMQHRADLFTSCISHRTKSFLGAHPGAPHLSPLLHGKNKGSKSFHIPSSSSVARTLQGSYQSFPSGLTTSVSCHCLRLTEEPNH